ncbi:MAG: hypothetical protein HDKAJFGB_00500 [Anaerolineae bacterium]|nr:hypothetical protein [Anaerolineae bacterium]
MSALPKWMFVGAFLVLLYALSASQFVLAHPLPPPETESAAALAPDKALPLNHFLCYQITNSTPVSETVRTQDQFDVRPKRTRVGQSVRFCNPVQKTKETVVTPIKFPNDHLIAYRIGQHDPNKSLNVEVKNQFGIQQLKVYKPAEVLMTPTRKLPHPKPQNTDHFKCYYVEGLSLGIAVTLEDQFQKGDTVVATPFALCNPTRKYHKDKWTEVLHPKAHLVCYQIQPLPFTATRDTANQFRKETITVTLADLLCVPSRKQILD